MICHGISFDLFLGAVREDRARSCLHLLENPGQERSPSNYKNITKLEMSEPQSSTAHTQISVFGEALIR